MEKEIHLEEKKSTNEINQSINQFVWSHVSSRDGGWGGGGLTWVILLFLLRNGRLQRLKMKNPLTPGGYLSRRHAHFIITHWLHHHGHQSPWLHSENPFIFLLRSKYCDILIRFYADTSRTQRPRIYFSVEKNKTSSWNLTRTDGPLNLKKETERKKKFSTREFDFLPGPLMFIITAASMPSGYGWIAEVGIGGVGSPPVGLLCEEINSMEGKNDRLAVHGGDRKTADWPLKGFWRRIWGDLG